MNKPFFSVVMPTRNRANLLPFAIQSVIDQTFDDFEIIVSDNFSTENIKKIVESFNDERIKYFRSEKPLSIGDSFTFALSHAKGEYISFLPNDDAFVSTMLERVKSVIDRDKAQVVAFSLAIYYSEDDIDYKRNTLVISPFTSETKRFDSKEAIRLLYREARLNNSEPDNFFIMPYVANVICHRSIFERLKTVRSDFFNFTPPDMYIAGAIFNLTDYYYCLDEPLFVWSKGEDNVTASAFKKGNEFIDHYQKLLNGYKLDCTPLKYALPLNCFVNAVLQAENDFKNSSWNSNGDWAEYYFQNYQSLLYLKQLNINISREMEEFKKILSNESTQIRREVQAKIKESNPTIKKIMRRFPNILKFAKKIFRSEVSTKTILISGEKYEFNNVLECSKVIKENFICK